MRAEHFILWLSACALTLAVGCDDTGSPSLAGDEAPLGGGVETAGAEAGLSAGQAGAEAGLEAGAGVEAGAEAGLWVEGGSPAGPELIEGPRGILHPESVEVIELNGVMITNGKSEPLELELPEDVVSLTMIALADESHMITVEELIDPFGEPLVSAAPPGVTFTQFDQFLSPFPGPFRSPNRVAVASVGLGALLAPNNPSVSVSGGSWGYQLAAINATTGMPANLSADLIILIRRGQQPERGRLDLHLHFTGARGWTAENAPDDPDFQVALERMRAFYQEVGIELGEVTYDDIPEQFKTADAGQGPNSILHQIYAQNQYSTGVALFFVERINSPFGAGSIGGIAGGTPGPSLLPGSPRSGVVVATEVDPDPRAIGHIMGHETGHFLGLYHTTELAFQGVHDQMPDTPQGQASNTNLMYPTVTAADAQLSQDQGWVMRRNANVFSVEE